MAPTTDRHSRRRIVPLACALGDVPAEPWLDSDNLVARVNLPNMHSPESRKTRSLRAGDPRLDGNAGERLAALETHAQTVREEVRDHMASKKDISDMKVWFLAGTIGTIVTIVSVMLRVMGT